MDKQEQGQGSDRAALTCHCQADPADPCFPARPKYVKCKLHRLTDEGKSNNGEVVRSEHWNSVRVTFNIPKDAARRLRRLAESADPSLRDLGITSVQFDGDQVSFLSHPVLLSLIGRLFVIAGHHVNVKQALVALSARDRKPGPG